MPKDKIQLKKENVSLKMGVVLLGEITRLLRTIRNLEGNVYVVGGLVTEGRTLRDIDIVLSNQKDQERIAKALGKYADRAHFLQQKGEPPSPIFIKLTGKNPTSPELKKKGERISQFEYAGL